MTNILLPTKVEDLQQPKEPGTELKREKCRSFLLNSRRDQCREVWMRRRKEKMEITEYTNLTWLGPIMGVKF